MGDGNTFVSHVDFLFEGKNFIQFGYQRRDDGDFRAKGWKHGTKESLSAKRFVVRDSTSRLLTPGYVYNSSQEGMIAFMFVEQYGN